MAADGGLGELQDAAKLGDGEFVLLEEAQGAGAGGVGEGGHPLVNRGCCGGGHINPSVNPDGMIDVWRGVSSRGPVAAGARLGLGGGDRRTARGQR